jgi:hypothetical protein
MRQGKTHSVGNGYIPFQGLQRRIGVFGRLPSGKTMSQLWLFWVAPIIGAGNAGIVYRWFVSEE